MTSEDPAIAAGDWEALFRLADAYLIEYDLLHRIARHFKNDRGVRWLFRLAM